MVEEESEELMPGYMDSFQCGVEDLETCKILYKEKRYSHSVFFLQQAVEKLVKSFGLRLGIYRDLKECRDKISHITPLAFFDMSDKLISNAPSITKEIFGKEIDFSPYQEPLNVARIKVKNKKIADYMSYEATMDYLREFKGRFESIQPEWNAMLKAACKPLLVDGELTDEMRIMTTIVFNYSFIGTSLLYFSFITYPHESSTRYPDEYPKPQDYNENLGIIRDMPYLLEYLDMIVNRMNELFTLIDENERLAKGKT